MDNITAEFDWKQTAGYDDTVRDAAQHWEAEHPGRRVTKCDIVAIHEQASRFEPRYVVIRVEHGPA